MSLVVRLATIEEVINRIKPLLAAHWQEVALHKRALPLNPIWPFYYAEEQAGRLIVVIAESGAELIGYNVHFLNDMLHNAPAVMARNDIIYLNPKHRGGTTAIRMVRLGEQEAARRMASKISMHVKKGHDFSPLLIHLGYEEEETIFTKVIY